MAEVEVEFEVVVVSSHTRNPVIFFRIDVVENKRLIEEDCIAA